MTTMNDDRGCSVCPKGSENYEAFKFHDRRLAKKFGKMLQYDFRTEGGELFSCVAKTLEECRSKRDQWLASK